MTQTRRDLFRLSAGLVWFAACARAGQQTVRSRSRDGFLVMQLTDTHLGYTGPNNPDPRGSVERAIAEIAAWPEQPDLVIHTGDVTQLTADAGERRARLADAKQLFAKLGVPLHVLPGEHDASLDGGAAFADAFGPTRWAFEHGGTHFVGLDNASNPKGGLGDEQLRWLAARIDEAAGAPLAVFAHRPLFPLAPAWDWHTPDGDQAIALLAKHPNATVFYGHIHQSSIVKTGTTTHVSTRALVFPLPVAMSVPDKKPLPWDDTAADHGLGYRGIVRERDRMLWVEHALVG